MALLTDVKCLTCFVFVLTLASHLETRSLRHRHGHRYHPDRNLEEDSLPRELSLRQLEEESMDHMDLSRRVHQVHRNGATRGLRSETRRKRHNGRQGSISVGVSELTDRKWREFQMRRQMNRELQEGFSDLSAKNYKLDVKEAQNSSICSYTVVMKSDENRVPRDIEYVICNHAGSDCHSSSYCCVQTYRMVDVKYKDGSTDRLQVDVGCVCACKNCVPELNDPELRISLDE